MGLETRKGQNALEYLVTHAWLFLILIIVVSAFLSIGVFSSSNLSPKAQPGSCQVQRPSGPGKTTYIGLGGTCNGELPEFVASFDGKSSNVVVTSNTYIPFGSKSRTMSAWFYATSLPSTNNVIFYYGSGSVSSEASFAVTFNALGGVCSLYNPCEAVSTGTWYMVTLTYNGSACGPASYGGGNLYVDGALVGTPGGCGYNLLNDFYPFSTTATPVWIGGNSTGYYFSGRIADVQLYSTALTTNSVLTLYTEGIGGAPISLGNLAGWWPLNGNTQDYSGNNESGTGTNVVYTAQWTGGYSSP
jgi:hypothetical protein